jgi:CRP/FNR family transcriptional regulator
MLEISLHQSLNMGGPKILFGRPISAGLFLSAVAVLFVSIRYLSRVPEEVVEEETGNYMYIVLAGKVKVTKTTPAGKETILAIHQSGDFFGEMALLDGKTAPATVSAIFVKV